MARRLTPAQEIVRGWAEFHPTPWSMELWYGATERTGLTIWDARGPDGGATACVAFLAVVDQDVAMRMVSLVNAITEELHAGFDADG